MNLDYKILWFEDNKQAFDIKNEIVQEIVEDLGFHYPHPLWKENDEGIDKLQFEDFDLIITDLNLSSDSTNGGILIDKIRKLDVFTEIIFYSSSGEKAVRDKLKEFDVDGVYCASREDEEFKYKVKKVIQTTVKKVQDINNIRGLIMTGASEIDHLMTELIKIIIDNNYYELKQSLSDSIIENVEKKVESKKKAFERYKRNSRVDQIIEDTLMFDSQQKTFAIQYIFNGIDFETIEDFKEKKFQDKFGYFNKKRNILAHGIVKIKDGIKIIEGNSSDAPIDFNDQTCFDLRMELRNYKKMLTEILNHLKAE